MNNTCNKTELQCVNTAANAAPLDEEKCVDHYVINPYEEPKTINWEIIFFNLFNEIFFEDFC